jgi:Mrp family chromosome partitioning ATPase
MNSFACAAAAPSAQMRRRVGIVDAHQADGPLHPLQQFKVDAGRLADLAGGHVITVVTDQPARRHQHRNRGCPDLLSGDALLEQPRDQLGPLGTSAALQTVEQLLDIGLIHSDNV